MKLYELLESFFELLLESKLDWIKSNMGHKLTDVNDPENSNIDSTLDKLLSFDPAKGKNLVWIVKMYISGEFKLSDGHKIEQILSQFERLKSKLSKKDINQYKNLDELKDDLDQYSHISDNELKSGKQKKRETKLEGVELIMQGNGMTILKPLTQEAACLYGKGTKWCTAYTDPNTPNRFKEYKEQNGNLFIILYKDEKFQFYLNSDTYDPEFRNASNERITLSEIHSLSLNPTYNKFVKTYIAEDAESSYFYAKDALQAPFKLGEHAIATDAYYSYFYAINVLNKPFKLGEPVIFKDNKFAKDYIEFISNF